jgi:ABC-type nitrate/sulfonate/bicarbonate transport system substrate-binding protein
MVAAAAVLGACGGNTGQSSKTAENLPHPDSVTMAVPGVNSAAFVPHAVAVGRGYYDEVQKKYGLTISFQDFGSGTDALAAVNGGSAMGGLIGVVQLIKTNNKNPGALQAVLDEAQGGGVVLVGHKKFEQSRGKDVTKYDGGTWGYTREGSTSQLFMKRVAEAAGVDWKKQKGIAVGSTTAFISALQQGRADMVAMDPTSAAKAMDAGIGYEVLNTADYSVVSKIWGFQVNSPLTFTSEFIKKYPQLSVDLVKAELRGLLDLQKNIDKPDVVLKMTSPEFQKANTESWATQWRLASQGFKPPVNGTFTTKAIADTVKFGIDVGLMTTAESGNVSADFTNTLVIKAYQELGLKAPEAS